jgi:hypothetical protein
MMAAKPSLEDSIPATAEAPPAYTDIAAQHGSLPVRSPAGKPLRIFPLDIPILQALKGKRMILASASPRRKQLLAQVPINLVAPPIELD